MPTELTLRPATTADAEAVVAVHLASRKAASMPPSVHADEDALPWLSSRLQEDRAWVAEQDGRVVAYARFTDTWLDDLYVDPPYAGRGIGGALLDVVKSELPGGFCLWVFAMNRPARAFYARHGLIELERTDGSGNEERAPDIRMVWPGEQPLDALRGLIDEVDEQLGDLLARRAALTRAVQGIKPDAGRDPARERAIAEALAERAPALGVDRLAGIVDAIVSASLDAAGDVPRGS